MRNRPFQSAAVAEAYASYPRPLRDKLLQLRRMIFDTAAATDGGGDLEETLKWGEPSYLTPHSKSGSTVRVDRMRTDPARVAVYFNCQTDLVSTFRGLYPEL